jgi:hypothetical protein
MKDSSDPRDGWLYTEYMKYTPVAKDDEHGAMFFYVRDLLLKFCRQVRNTNISFQIFSVNAQELDVYVGDMKFDRIEVCTLTKSSSATSS